MSSLGAVDDLDAAATAGASVAGTFFSKKDALVGAVAGSGPG
jgi:hypothetical protein